MSGVLRAPNVRAIALGVLAMLATTVTVAQVPATATVSGRVVDDEGAPLAGVAVKIGDPDAGSSVSATSDSQGRFVFAGLASGRYDLAGLADGHVPTSYGAFGFRAPGTPVRVVEGEDVTGLVLTLPRFGSIRGTVFDHTDFPVQTRVTAYSVARAGDRLELRPLGSAQSTVHGRYLIPDLPPGAYLVRAAAKQVVPFPIREADDAAPELLPFDTFHGGVVLAAAAPSVLVPPGGIADGVDIHGRSLTTATVLVTAHAAGRDMKEAARIVVPLDEPEAGSMAVASRLLLPTADGDPVHTPIRLAAGRYGLVVQAEVDGERWWWSTILTADGRTPLAFEPALAPPATVSGRVEFESGASGAVRLALVPADRDVLFGPMRGASGAVDADGRFELTGLPAGQYVLRLTTPPPRAAALMLVGVTVDGRDVLDLPFPVVSGQARGDVVVRIARTPTSVTGQVVDETDAPRSDVALVVFPTDSRYWWFGSPRMQTVRPDTAGHFEVKGLPDGDYQIAVVRAALPEVFADNAFLNQLSAASLPVTVTNGQVPEPVVVRIPR